MKFYITTHICDHIIKHYQYFPGLYSIPLDTSFILNKHSMKVLGSFKYYWPRSCCLLIRSWCLYSKDPWHKDKPDQYLVGGLLDSIVNSLFLIWSHLLLVSCMNGQDTVTFWNLIITFIFFNAFQLFCPVTSASTCTIQVWDDSIKYLHSCVTISTQCNLVDFLSEYIAFLTSELLLCFQYCIFQVCFAIT